MAKAIAMGTGRSTTPKAQPGLLRVRADHVAEEQADHGRGGAPGQPPPTGPGQVTVGKDGGHSDHRGQQPGCLQSRPDGSQVADTGHRAWGYDYAMDPRFG